MVVQGELIVKFETIARGVGELVGGFSTAGKGKQPEKTPTTLGAIGGVGAKALMGTEGFGGLKKTMGVMSGPIGKLGGALMKGGVIGIATGGITAVLGIVSKALGSSSIFTGVAAQFWKIAGVMVDMLLMPLLPYMMKFIQWMMTKVMPEIMKLSATITRALNGDIGPLLSQLGSMWMEYIKFIIISLPRALADVIIVAVNNKINPFKKDTTVAEYRQKREDRAEEAETMKGGMSEGGQKRNEWFSKWIGFDYAVAMSHLKETGEQQREFGENLTKDAATTQKELTKVVDKEKNTGAVWWQKWRKNMYLFSILPNIRDDTHSYMETLSKEAENSGEGLFNWVKGINWGIFGSVGTAIKDAAMAVWGAVTGFFTGKDSEGAEVTPNLLSILPGLPSFPSLSDIDIVESIKKKAKDIYSSVMGFFTGKDSEGGETTPSIMSIIPGLPSFPSLTDIDIVGSITDKASEIWNGIDTYFTETLPGKIPTWQEIWEGVTSEVKNIKELLGDAKDAVVTKVQDIWGSWNPKGIMGIIPSLLENIPSWESIWSAATSAVGTIADLGTKAGGIIGNKISDLWGQWSSSQAMSDTGDMVTTLPHGIAGIIPNLLGRLPSFKKIFSIETYKDLGTLATDAVTDILGRLWGSWSGKTGIAGIIPLLVSKIPDIGSMMGDLGKMTVEGVSQKDRDKLIKDFGAKQVGEEHTYGQNEYDVTTTYDMELSIADYFKQIGSMIKEKAMIPVNWVQKKFNSLKATFDNLALPDWDFGGILNIVKDIGNVVIGGINKALCWVVEKYNSTVNALSLPWGMSDWALIDSPPQIDKWHTGGIVPGGPSAEVPAILQGGEQVIPRSARSQMGGGGGGTNQTFNININSNFSPGDIIRSIAQSGATDEVAYLNTVG